MEKEAKGKAPKIKPIHIAMIVVAAAAVIAAVYYLAAGSVYASAAAAGDNVSVYYTGRFTNGTIFSTNIGQQPLNFTVGSGQLIRGFSQGVIGMKPGQNRTITVQPSEGYGQVNQSLIVPVPLADFGNLTVTVGMQVKSSTGQQATVIAVNSTYATVDFNPPLAGKTLVFQVHMVAVRK